MSETRNESSRHLGISCEKEITNGLHRQTDRYQDILECASNRYDTFETVDRIKKNNLIIGISPNQCNINYCLATVLRFLELNS